MVLVGHVPHDVREGGAAGHGVAVVPLFVRAAHARLAERIRSRPAAVDIEDHRHDHVQVAGVPQQPVVLLPMGDVEPRHVEARILQTLRPRGDPRVQQERELVRRVRVFHPGLSVLHAAHDHDPDAIDLQPVQPVQALPDRLVVPAHQKVSRRPVPEIVLARAFPEEMPGVLGIDPHQPAATGVASGERARVFRLEIPLPVGDRVGMNTRLGRHEPNAKHTAVL